MIYDVNSNEWLIQNDVYRKNHNKIEYTNKYSPKSNYKNRYTMINILKTVFCIWLSLENVHDFFNTVAKEGMIDKLSFYFKLKIVQCNTFELNNTMLSSILYGK